MTGRDILSFVENECRELGAAEPDIMAILLVGSCARNEQREDSDIDLIILSSEWKKYLADRSWVNRFGRCCEERIEYYGLITSLRVFYPGMEIEFGLGGPEWLHEPLDEGTAQVLRDGYRPIFERNDVLKPIAGIKPYENS